MKRSVFIIIGVGIVLVLLCVWVYMLFFGSPDNAENIFTDLGFGDTTDPTYVEPEIPEEDNTTVDVSSPDSPLQQLTTQPVAGYREIDTGTSTPNYILFSEVGTGHIFSINLESGEEERVSGTTLPSSQKAVFTPNGEYVLVGTGLNISATHNVGSIDTDNNQTTYTEVLDRIESFTATLNNRFLYATPQDSSLVVKEYDPATNLSSVLFTIPFREASIEWGSTASGPHYVYPKASGLLEGYLYQFENGQMRRMAIDGFGLSAQTNNDYVIYSKQVEQQYQSFLYDLEFGESVDLGFPVIPEKCVLAIDNFTRAICANTNREPTLAMPDVWYSGEFESADSLWRIDAERPGQVTLMVNILNESGRSVDVVDMHFHQDEQGVFFQNRIDQTLWTYNQLY